MAKQTARRLVILANRLPVQRGEDGAWKPSAGGLVTALEPVLRTTEGVWIGWTGAAGRAPAPFTNDGVRIRPVGLTAAEVDAFYEGYSNRTLWPLYHDAIRPPAFNPAWWEPYVAVNRRFAEAAAKVARPRDLVWVHDYHLQLAPGMLRALRPDVRIGFFLHIPFPPEELFEWLPQRRAILEGLLGADVVGFQTSGAAKNFSRLAREHTEAEGSDTQLTVGRREVRVGAFPISIDFDWFDSRARLPETAAAALGVRRRLGASRKVILSVDRLDYTKGIEHRLQAYREALREKVVTVDSAVLMQIAVPSREHVGEYAETRTRIEQMVGRINGEFSEPGRVAVHYFRRAYTREELVTFYRAADVMLVTPLRDGMNLVAKEYVACRPDGSGALILSEFAGAARELRRALLVNPRDIHAVARSIGEALSAPKEDLRRRMAILRMVVRRHDVHEWARSFLEALRA